MEEWQHFATLTFKNPLPPSPARKRMLFAWLRSVCSLRGCRWSALRWLCREEAGEATGRYHYHVLLNGLPPDGVTLAANFILMHAWEKLGGGMARVFIFNGALPGVEYVMKGLSKLDGRSHGAQCYELGKFAAVEEVTGLIPARSLLWKWQKGVETNRRHRKAHEMRAHKCDRLADRGNRKFWAPKRFPHPADTRASY